MFSKTLINKMPNDSNRCDSFLLWYMCGYTLARRLAEAGRKVLVLEKRQVVNGNIRCECVDGAPWEEKLLW